MINRLFIFIQILLFLLLCASNLFLLIHPSFSIIILCNFLILIFYVVYQYNTFKKLTNIMLQKEVEVKDKQEAEFQQSLKNVYDEHIFSITHELRSPLAVITASCANQYNTLKKIYKSLENREHYKQEFKEAKTQLEYIRHQSEIVESFIASISEHASYVSEEGSKKYINLHNYLISVIINSPSYSRNMKIFKNNISFGDLTGSDFMNMTAEVSPHDLSRMLINIMTNSADAASDCYKLRKENDETYEPKLKIRCIKSIDKEKNIILTPDFIRINCHENEGNPLYLIIEDNACGISPENIEKIFKYRYSTKTNNNENHHGLGLYLTIKLANKNGLKLYVKTSETGTLFAIGFPNIYLGDYNIKLDNDSNLDNNNKMTYFISDDSKELYKLYKSIGSISDTKYPIIKQKSPKNPNFLRDLLKKIKSF